MSEFAEWESFYVIVGSAAGALIGLQFVVLTLIAERPPLRAADAGAAFSTPTIVHFGTALLLSAILRAPWQAVTPVAALWGFVGLSGAVYTGIVARRMRVQTAYRPARPCSASELRRCCCSSSAFITPGTASPTTYLSTGGMAKTERVGRIRMD